MTAKERILIIRLAKKIERQPEYANRKGISVANAKENVSQQK